MKLSLVIPCYNEAENLPLLVKRISETFTRDDVEVILVDNGSSDDTPAVLESQLKDQPNIRFVRVEINQGYGFGILAGLRQAQGEIIGWTHADMQTDPADALKGLAYFEQSENIDQLFVKGLRHGRPIADRIFTFGMTCFETILMHKFMQDINAQPTLFSRSFFETWKSPPHDFSLDLYAYYVARKARLSIQRFDVLFGERAHGASHWNIDFRSKLKFIKRTFDYSIKLRSSSF